MKQISVTRRLNIRQHIKVKRESLNDIAVKIGRNPNYLSQLFSLRSTLDISDDMVRQLELAIDVEELSLDKPVDSEPDMLSPSIIASTLFEIKLKDWFSSEIDVYPPLDFNVTPHWMMRVGSKVIAVAELANGQSEQLEKRVLASMIATGCQYGVLGCETPEGLISTFYLNNAGQAFKINESDIVVSKGGS